MFWSVDEVIKCLMDQVADLESIDEESRDADALRVAADLLKKTVETRTPEARVLPLETLHTGWEKLWLQLRNMPEGGDVMATWHRDGAWILENAGCKYILSGDLYNRTWRVWDRMPTGKDMQEWTWEEEAQ